MFRWLRSKFDPEARRLDSLRQALEISSEALPLDQIYPLFVPASFFARGNWPGPQLSSEVAGLGLTWSVFLPDQTMRYVDHSTAAHWESRGINWRDHALANLRKASANSLRTHDFRRDNGFLYAVAMMHSDGNGPARLMLRDSLSELFPEGYRVGLPEMSCGIAVSSSATKEECEKMAGMIDHCFRNGTRPLINGVHEPALF